MLTLKQLIKNERMRGACNPEPAQPSAASSGSVPITQTEPTICFVCNTAIEENQSRKMVFTCQDGVDRHRTALQMTGRMKMNEEIEGSMGRTTGKAGDSGLSAGYISRQLEIRKFLRQIPTQDHYHLIKALDLMLDEIERLCKEEQRLTDEVVALKLAAIRNT